MGRLLGAIIVAAFTPGASGDTHYAARPDTNPWVRPAYPYTSPETATPYIMDAMDAADPGDRVFVLPGRYGWDGATYRVKPGVDLMGSGRNVTTMLGRVTVGQGSMVSGFRFLDTGVSAYSGGIINDSLFERAVVSARPPATVRRCTFTGPTPAYESAIGGMYGGDLRVLDCTFDLAGEGMAISVWNVQQRGLTVARCRFRRCATAISVGDSYARVDNCLFMDNEVGVDTGILDLTIENCTFYRNEWAITSSVSGYLQSVKNSILWGNTSGNVLETPKEYKGDIYMPVITFSDVQGGYPGKGNIDADPIFLSPSADEADLHLCAFSPCVDAGDPFSGYANEPEPNGGRVNMGAYGNTWEATTSELVDMDADNMRDDWEVEHFGALERDGSGDGDGDELADHWEYRYLSDPDNPDTDGDGLLDGGEVYGFTLEDGQVVYSDFSCDPIVADTDNDGTPDGKEVSEGTNPLDSWDAFTIVKLWIEDNRIHVVHPVQPRWIYNLESSFWPNGPFGTLCGDWEGR